MDLLPESMKVIILARLQMRDIARIKRVCREWKSLLESSYFRDVYRTLNQRNLSSPWSILYRDKFSTTALEFFCERWGFTQSIGSCVSRFLDEVKAASKSSRVGALTITDGLILLDMSTKSDLTHSVWLILCLDN
ncbi:putative F-box protein [Cardamine amara subsp. amara]|uniref:F-box protein n=1 Tax=Cardamine amara subsp. amara TaxID=228776 RepID=A0ABD1AH81_CARAN